MITLFHLCWVWNWRQVKSYFHKYPMDFMSYVTFKHNRATNSLRAIQYSRKIHPHVHLCIRWGHVMFSHEIITELVILCGIPYRFSHVLSILNADICVCSVDEFVYCNLKIFKLFLTHRTISMPIFRLYTHLSIEYRY